MKKKILFVNSSLTSGGSEKVMTIIADEFDNNNYDVSMIILYPQEKENYHVNSSIKLYKFIYEKRNRILRWLEKISKTRKIIKKGNYDYIISFMHEININVLISSFGLHTPVIVSERNNPSARKENIFQRKITNHIYKMAQTIVLQTNQVKEQYPKYLYKKCVIIPNPISANIPAPYEDNRQKIIIAVGRLCEQKNFTMLINAFSKIDKKLSEYQLYIYGDGPLRRELEGQVASLHLENKVFLSGYIDNVNEIMKTASLYISSSNYEGISNAMLEALAMGVPTICTDCPVGGAAMVIKDHENGILIPVGDENKLTASINEVLGNIDLLNELSQNAVGVKKTYSLDKIFKKWENLIK